MNKKDGRNINRDALEYLRMRSIGLWKKGRDISEIASDFGVSPSAVYNWISTYKKGGLNNLKKRKAPGAQPKLSSNEVKILVDLLKDSADNYGFESPLWDVKKIQQLIKRKFEKDIHFSNVWRLLKKMNLSCQKPKRSAHERDEKVAEKWLKEEWPKIKAHARRWQAMLYFQDEAGVSLTAVLGKTWAPKGETPVVKVTGKRGGLCVTSAISPAGRMVFRIEKGKVNANKHIEFLKQIMKQHPHRKVIVIEDRASPHRAKKVDEFVNQNKKQFALYKIPAYSPEFNPDEHVWAYLKANKLKTHQAQSTKELKCLVKNGMHSIQRKGGRVSSFFYGPLFK